MSDFSLKVLPPANFRRQLIIFIIFIIFIEAFSDLCLGFRCTFLLTFFTFKNYLKD